MNTVVYLLARVRTALVAVLAIHLALDPLKAHEGPEHEIEELTEQIAKGETSDLYLQRAIEYRVLGKNAEAARDLEHAARLDPASLLVQRELGRVYFALGKTNEAIDILSHALKTKTEEPTELGALRVLRAEFLGARREDRKALEDCEAALRLQLSNVEWYLLRSDLQRRLHQKTERITGLEQGIKETGAGILQTEWIEALLDDNQFQAALPHIERELAASRIQNSWRLRRARALLGLGNTNGAKSDLDAALLEMKPRVAAKDPDVTLLTEYAQALDLAGESEEAQLQYERARDAGADDWVKDRIKTLKAEKKERDKKTANP